VGGVLVIGTLLPGGLNDRLYRQYYTPMEDASLISRGGESNFNTDFNRALNLYSEGDYSDAASEFSELAERDPSQAESALFLSLSNMGAGNYEESAKLLESFLTRFNAYQPEAKWYLSLCYLKLDQPDKAIPLLAELASLGGKYGHDSQKIIQSLR
jgi:tetratricopeptide (TPR) repeat protein